MNSTINGYDCVKQIKGKLYIPIEYIITENEGKRHKLKRVEYSTLKDMLRSLYYQKITINFCQFVNTMTRVKLNKRRAKIFYSLY